MIGLSDRLAGELAALNFADLPDRTVAAARRVVLDAVGVMLGASGLAAEARPFIDLAASSGQGPCRILGTDRTAPAPTAALANGALAHALDFEDAFDIAPGHPNASLVPALIALSQAEAPIDGRRFLTALVAGCELSCRMGLALRQPMEAGGWYPPPILAGFGATAGAAHLLGLSGQGLRDALSLTLCQVTMPGEIKHSQGTVIRAVREAFPAQAAVQSALLARAGVPGFEEPLEGRSGFYALYAGGQFDPACLLQGPPQGWWIEQLTFKPWPSCRGTHPFIAMALELRGSLPADLAAISRIRVRHDAVQAMLVQPLARKQAPAVAIDAKFSIPWCLAVALIDGDVGLDSFRPERLSDPEVLDLAGRIAVEQRADPEWQRGSGGALAIDLADGTTLATSRPDAPGGPAAPLDDAALVTKFRDCAARAARPMTGDAAQSLAEAILSLERCEDVGELLS